MRFYTYELVAVPDNRVVYVGKGHGNRLNEHLKIAMNPRAPYYGRRLYQQLRGVLAQGKRIESRIVFESENELEALVEERRRIELYGFDNLFNVASHAFQGRRLKRYVKEKISQIIKDKWARGEYAGKKTVKGMKFPNKLISPNLKKPRKVALGRSGFKGVFWWETKGKTPRWGARIVIDGKTRSLGYSDSVEQAARFYDDASEAHFGTRPNGTKS